VVRSEDLSDITYVLKLNKDHFKLPDNWKLEDLKDEWKKRLFVCDDLTKLGISNNPANSMMKLFAFEPKTKKVDKKLNKMKRGLDRVFRNYNSAQMEMEKLNKEKEKQEKINEEESQKSKVISMQNDDEISIQNKEEDEILGEKIENHLDEEVLFENGITPQKTGLDSKTIKLPGPNINNEFIENSQLTKNKNYVKLQKNNYEKIMHTERRNYPSPSQYQQDMSISKYKGAYKFQKGFYNGNKFEHSRTENHYDLKARKPVIYSQLLRAADYCRIPRSNLNRYIISPEVIVKSLCPLLEKCGSRFTKFNKPKNWGLSDLQMLLFKLNQLPKDKIQFKAMVSTDKKDLPIIPNFDNRNPKPNKYGVVGQYRFKGIVQNAGPQYQALKRSLLNNRYTPLRVNYSKI
jgi:hypothetical protein